MHTRRSLITRASASPLCYLQQIFCDWNTLVLLVIFPFIAANAPESHCCVSIALISYILIQKAQGAARCAMVSLFALKGIWQPLRNAGSLGPYTGTLPQPPGPPGGTPHHPEGPGLPTPVGAPLPRGPVEGGRAASWGPSLGPPGRPPKNRPTTL